MKRKPSPSPKSPAARPTAAKSPRANASSRAKSAPSSKSAVTKAKAVPAPAPEATTKQAQLIALLRSAAGASMADMMNLTGWQPHTVRGMLSGSLRKRMGLEVQCQRIDGTYLYRIVEAAAS